MHRARRCGLPLLRDGLLDGGKGEAQLAENASQTKQNSEIEQNPTLHTSHVIGNIDFVTPCQATGVCASFAAPTKANLEQQT